MPHGIVQPPGVLHLVGEVDVRVLVCVHVCVRARVCVCVWLGCVGVGVGVGVVGGCGCGCRCGCGCGCVHGASYVRMCVLHKYFVHVLPNSSCITRHVTMKYIRM